MLVPGRAIFRYTAEELAGGRPSDLRVGLREGAGWLLLEGTANTADSTIVAQLPRLGVMGLLPGVCTTCTPCAPETCRITTDNETMPMVAGKCLDLPNGCKKCVATCDNDGDGFCPGDPETASGATTAPTTIPHATRRRPRCVATASTTTATAGSTTAVKPAPATPAAPG